MASGILIVTHNFSFHIKSLCTILLLSNSLLSLVYGSDLVHLIFSFNNPGQVYRLILAPFISVISYDCNSPDLLRIFYILTMRLSDQAMTLIFIRSIFIFLYWQTRPINKMVSQIKKYMKRSKFF